MLNINPKLAHAIDLCIFIYRLANKHQLFQKGLKSWTNVTEARRTAIRKGAPLLRHQQRRRYPQLCLPPRKSRQQQQHLRPHKRANSFLFKKR